MDAAVEPTLFINEIFHSVQGESTWGNQMGQESLFVGSYGNLTWGRLCGRIVEE